MGLFWRGIRNGWSFGRDIHQPCQCSFELQQHPPTLLCCHFVVQSSSKVHIQLSYLNLNSLLKPKSTMKLRNCEGLENAWPQHPSYTHEGRASKYL